MKTYEGNGIHIQTYKRGGYFILRICQKKTFWAATRSGKAVLETCWMSPYEKKFEFAEQANRYFSKIKMSNSLRLTKDEPKKYVSYDGTIKEY